jgi:nickel transport protein
MVFFTIMCGMVFFRICIIDPSPAFAHRVTVYAWAEEDAIYGEGKLGGGKRPVNVPVKLLAESGDELSTTQTDRDGEFSFSLSEIPDPALSSGDLKVVLDAGPGHRAEWTLRAADLPKVFTSQDPPGGDTAETPPEKIRPGTFLQSTDSSAAEEENTIPAASTEKTDVPAAINKSQEKNGAGRNKASPKTPRTPGAPAVSPAKIRALMEETLEKERIRLQIEIRDSVQAALAPVKQMLQDSIGKGPGLAEILGGIGYILGLAGLAAYFHYRRKIKELASDDH